jgi:hypothetical protein
LMWLVIEVFVTCIFDVWQTGIKCLLRFHILRAVLLRFISSRMWCDVSLGKEFLKFWRTALPTSSGWRDRSSRDIVSYPRRLESTSSALCLDHEVCAV